MLSNFWIYILDIGTILGHEHYQLPKIRTNLFHKVVEHYILKWFDTVSYVVSLFPSTDYLPFSRRKLLGAFSERVRDCICINFEFNNIVDDQVNFVSPIF